MRPLVAYRRLRVWGAIRIPERVVGREAAIQGAYERLVDAEERRS